MRKQCDFEKIYSETKQLANFPSVLVTTRICQLQYTTNFFLLLRDAGRACGTVSVTCPVCRQLLSHCSDHAVVFSCGHGYHSACLGEPKSCYKCLNVKGWAPVATNLAISESPPPVSNTQEQDFFFRYMYFTLHFYAISAFFFFLQRKKQLLPPEFLRHRDLTLRLAPSCPIPDLEGIF